MKPAAKTETVLPLAALFPLTENPHLGHPLPTAALYPGITLANSNTASGLRVCLYDSGRRSRSTGKERDAETGLDFFGARYFSGAQGRFTSPDWSAKPQPIPYATLSDPQTLNLYGYVRNNPLKNHDPDGHVCIFGIGNTCTAPPPSATPSAGAAVEQQWLDSTGTAAGPSPSAHRTGSRRWCWRHCRRDRDGWRRHRGRCGNREWHSCRFRQ